MISIKNARDLIDSYRPTDDVMDDGNNLRRVIFSHKLTDMERMVILMLAEYGSQKKVAEALSVSSSTVSGWVKRTRRKIRENMV